MSKSLLLLSMVSVFCAPLKPKTEPLNYNISCGYTNVIFHHGGSVSKIKPAFATPSIIVSVASGTTSACVGAAATGMQQFTVSGNNLTDNITVTAPAGFEISANPAGGFSNSFFFVTSGSTVTPKTVYVRVVTSATPANLSGAVNLTSAGAVTKKVAVKGTINALPAVDPISDLVYANGDLTAWINFTGTGNTFYWTNDRPSIGLPTSGTDNIEPFKAVNTGSSPVIAHISVTAKKANVAYIPDFNTSTVLAVNTINNKIIDTIPVGPAPGWVAISPDGKKVYVANLGSNTVSVINTATNAVKTVPTFDTPTGMVYSKDGTRVYVAGATGQCTVIDAVNDVALTSLSFFSGAAGLAISNDGKWLYTANYAMGDVRVYDTATGADLGNIPAPGANYAVSSPDGRKIYVTGSYSNCIYVIDAATASLSATINIPSGAAAIAVSPDGSRIYVTNQAAGTVSVINATNNAFMVALPVGKSPEGISITPDGKYVYVANVDAGTVSIINTADYTVAATISCGQYPRALGSFITPGINDCLGNPTNFKITVNTSPTTISPGAVGGLITTCIGSASTTFQQFTVSGNNLSGNITATSPAGFEISFSQTSGFSNVLTLIQSGGAVTNKVIYVRAKAAGTPANLSGNVLLTTPGASDKNVAVKGVVNDLPVTDVIDDKIYNNGDVTAPIEFKGTGNTYNWINDQTSIGLGASGTGDIPSFTATNTGTATVKANITVTSSSDDYLYLVGTGGMVLVNASNNKQAGTINTGGLATVGTAVSPDGKLVAITDVDANTVKFINTTTHKVVSTVNNVISPIGICFSPDGKKVYVANVNTANMTIIDVATGAASTVYVGWAPYGLAASPDGLNVYVGCIGENAVIAVNTQTRQVTPIKVSFGPTGIAVSPDNSRVYATSAQYNGLLKVIDAAAKKVIATLPIGDVSTGLCVSPDGKRIYIANTKSNNVMVVDAESIKVIATIPVNHEPVGITITPDGKSVYVVNDRTNIVNIISTATNTITGTITAKQQLGKSFGNFFVPGTGCSSLSKFTITVNVTAPAITAGAVTGNISACLGSPSTDTQQFKVSGSKLSADITVTAPAKFEVSLNETSGFASSLTIPQVGGTVTDKVVYVRAATSGTAGNFTGDVVLSSIGVPDVKVAVNGIVNDLPTVNQVIDKNFNSGETTTLIQFTGNQAATTYNWTNDNPAIGLPASGSGDIPEFTAGNNGLAVITANITVVPSTASCTGGSMTFKINVKPAAPLLTAGPVSGIITACEGSASADPNIQEFTISGTSLTGDVIVAAPANFQLSLSRSTGYGGTLTLTPNAGKLNSTKIYVQSASAAPAGHISGDIILSTTGLADQKIPVDGHVTAMPVMAAVSSPTFNNGELTTPIQFNGATTYTWTNDNPAIGLAAGGSGNIPAFTATNNGQTAITANIMVIPSNGLCDGNPVPFKINIKPTPPSLTAGAVSGNITACQGSASTSPNIQQFVVNGSNLTANILVTAPANFEVSLTTNTGYTTTLTLTQVAGKVNNTNIYVRLAATAPAGYISGNVLLSSAGVTDQNIAVDGDVSALPTMAAVSSPTFNNGELTTSIQFTGATTYTWTNDNPAIGLPANGNGDIPAFTPVNNGASTITANILVTPSNGSCSGNAVSFKINVKPTPPSITAGIMSGSITACEGSASANPNIRQFSISGSNLTGNIRVTAPANFEVSLNLSSGYGNTQTLTPTAGKVNNATIYIRSAATAPAGHISGDITLSSTGIADQKVSVDGDINALPVMAALPSPAYTNGDPVSLIHFTGATTYSWTNTNPAIGIASAGNGDIGPFTAVNNGQTPITATITVIPSNGSCTGAPVSFSITIKPTVAPAITFSGNLSPLTTIYGTSSSTGSFSVSGTNLTSGVTVTPPAGFELSTDGVNFNNTVTIGGPGTLNATTVYIRLSKATGVGNYSGNIALSTGGTSNNLSMPGSIVTPASVIVKADNKTRPVNSQNPPFTVKYIGFVNNQNESVLTKSPLLGTDATLAAAAGTYPIYFTGNAEAGNYTFTYIPGVLTITPAGVLVYNTFTPNGDGNNDTWVIKNIENYPNCTVNVFNRWGAKVFSSVGYGQQWNGQLGSNPVPVGTYYYVINLSDGSPAKAGWVAILR
ncbi:gliding motility-associated C-terminal domain-containing protein [Mucilaginibacter celer]|uniref:MBG domain-containing protein n=1 Tax=Mucilaginibacter celer TaxID=2305508 RepID=A0A494VQS6_9SPHI|nr:gliding motility-associated C-terminal domain-containing protein [Mucilaginibacter celer]AYL95640.1 hypothetical protein HYN43_010200 [Mucilaginibacter celer]